MESLSQYLSNTTVYDTSASNCYAFRRGTDMVDGHSLALGNMVSGFPFDIEGIRFHNSEAAYIAGMFSNGSENHLNIQRELIVETNGFMAKKRIRRQNEHVKRNDWESFNVQWMLYVVWCKCIGNEQFRTLLLSFPPQAIIIEDSTLQKGSTASFWGAKNKILYTRHKSLSKALKAEGMSKHRRIKILDDYRLNEWRKEGEYIGCNAMGKIFMLCRDALISGIVPDIDFSLLNEKQINLCGKILTFNAETPMFKRA